jgi:hypothetical protein
LMNNRTKLLSSECLHSHGWPTSHECEICGKSGIKETSASKTAPSDFGRLGRGAQEHSLFEDLFLRLVH